MSKLAVICCYNQEMLMRQMRDSIQDGGLEADEIDFIGLDNREKRFSSAAEAYNHAIAAESLAEVLVFCHQDIIFLEGSLKRIYELCIRSEQALYGAAGVRNTGHGGKERVISAMAVIQRGWNYTTLKKDSIEDVFTLDECLIAGNRRLFESLRFDEEVCSGWHLYAAELSLQCIKRGIPVRVFDANIVHLSRGTQDSTFYECEKRLVKKYHRDFRMISYTCGWAYTDPVLYGLLCLYRRLRYSGQMGLGRRGEAKERVGTGDGKL